MSACLRNKVTTSLEVFHVDLLHSRYGVCSVVCYRTYTWLIGTWKKSNHVIKRQRVGVYHEGQRPPGQRWGSAECPKASSPSACCLHLGTLYPDNPHTQRQTHTHTCVKVYAWYWKMPLRNVSCPLMAVNDYHGHNQVSKYAQNIEVRPTVIMIQGQSFEQKSSSINLWNVASFSTMRTNLAEDTISGK